MQKKLLTKPYNLPLTLQGNMFSSIFPRIYVSAYLNMRRKYRNLFLFVIASILIVRPSISAAKRASKELYTKGGVITSGIILETTQRILHSVKKVEAAAST